MSDGFSESSAGEACDQPCFSMACFKRFTTISTGTSLPSWALTRLTRARGLYSAYRQLYSETRIAPDLYIYTLDVNFNLIQLAFLPSQLRSAAVEIRTESMVIQTPTTSQ